MSKGEIPEGWSGVSGTPEATGEYGFSPKLTRSSYGDLSEEIEIFDAYVYKDSFQHSVVSKYPVAMCGEWTGGTSRAGTRALVLREPRVQWEKVVRGWIGI